MHQIFTVGGGQAILFSIVFFFYFICTGDVFDLKQRFKFIFKSENIS